MRPGLHDPFKGQFKGDDVFLPERPVLSGKKTRGPPSPVSIAAPAPAWQEPVSSCRTTRDQISSGSLTQKDKQKDALLPENHSSGCAEALPANTLNTDTASKSGRYRILCAGAFAAPYSSYTAESISSSMASMRNSYTAWWSNR